MRTVFTGGQVFDGTGSPSFPGEVVLEGDRVVEVRAGHSPELLDDATIIDVAGHT
jgi:N-acyl-D-aspartate/D-glutamate deacylase